MNIVFFDVDGVLNSKEYIMNTGPLKKGEVGGLDPLALAHFERLTTVPNTVFVMSSSWRREGLRHVQDVFIEAGFSGYITGVTPAYNDATRGEEISDTIGTYIQLGVEIDNVVVIDNEPSAEPKDRACFFVYTNYLEGLTEELAEQARQYLLTGRAPS